MQLTPMTNNRGLVQDRERNGVQRQTHSSGFIPDRERLLELHTQFGTVFLRPSTWDRLRLRWIFRNFRLVSAQSLAGYSQRVIHKLSQSEQVKPSRPLVGSDIIGVIEDLRPLSSTMTHETIPGNTTEESGRRPFAGPVLNLTSADRLFAERLGPGYLPILQGPRMQVQQARPLAAPALRIR